MSECHDHEPLMKPPSYRQGEEDEPVRIELMRVERGFPSAVQAFVCRSCGAVYVPYRERL